MSLNFMVRIILWIRKNKSVITSDHSEEWLHYQWSENCREVSMLHYITLLAVSLLEYTKHIRGHGVEVILGLPSPLLSGAAVIK